MNQGGIPAGAVLFLPGRRRVMLPKEEESPHRGFGTPLASPSPRLGLLKVFTTGYAGFQLVVDRSDPGGSTPTSRSASTASRCG